MSYIQRFKIIYFKTIYPKGSKIDSVVKSAETEGLIREYQKNSKPTQATMKILEFYGGEKKRTDKGAAMSRCIQRLVEEELVHNYQRDSTPDEETRNPLKYAVGMNWREDKGQREGDAACK